MAKAAHDVSVWCDF